MRNTLDVFKEGDTNFVIFISRVAFALKLIIAVAFGTVRMHFVHGCTLCVVLIGNRHP